MRCFFIQRQNATSAGSASTRNIGIILFIFIITLTAAKVVFAAPTTWVVTSTADTGGTCATVPTDCTLRQAMANALNSDTIVFDASLDGATINLGNQLTTKWPVNSGGDVTLDASNLSNKITLDAGGNARVIKYNGKGTLTLINVVITGGSTNGFGGGVTSNGSLSIKSSEIVGNEAGTGAGLRNGGGVHANGDIDVTDSTIAGNRVNQFGGGISTGGDVTVTNSAITGNVADVRGGGISAAGDVTVVNGVIAGNHADGDQPWQGGGGIRVGNASTITLQDSLILGNTIGYTDDDDDEIKGTNNVNATNSSFDLADFAPKMLADIFESPVQAGAGTPQTGGAFTLVAGSPAAGMGLVVAPIVTDNNSVINPDPDVQFRNGDSTQAAAMTSHALEPYHYGTYLRGQVVTLSFLVRNTGAKPLELSELTLPSFLSLAGDALPETLASFESALLQFTVNTDQAGTLTGDISLASNDPDAFESPFTFAVSVTVADTPANALHVLAGVTLPDVTVTRGQKDVAVWSFQLRVPEHSVAITTDALSLVASNVTGVKTLHLYIDGGTRGQRDARDIPLASLEDFSEGITFEIPPRTFTPGVPMWFLVTADF